MVYVDGRLGTIVDVALAVPVMHPFSYAVPERLLASLQPGMRVVCPFGKRTLIGVALAIREVDGTKGPLKPLVRILDKTPSVPADLLAFLSELARYYIAPIGEAIALALPPVDRETFEATQELSLFPEKGGIAGRTVLYVRATAKNPEKQPRGQAALILAHLRSLGESTITHLEKVWSNARAAVKSLREAGLVETEEKLAADAPAFTDTIAPDVPKELNAHQSRATESIEAALAGEVPTTFLLRGVTGSGKTEVYLRAITAARKAGRGSIMLVPEIALTPQLVARFRARFGDDVGILHSGLTPKERLVMWKRIHSGELDVAIGARSALFAPVRKLGLIVVDEEHDPSFKQEEGVRYHARDMAILRAHRAKGITILGSATPSLESVELTNRGRAILLELPERATPQAMPKVELVDLRRIGPGPTGDRRISLPLHRALEEVVKSKEQAILFLNRRGFAPSVRCEGCGELAECPNCAVALTFHKRGGGMLRCHYCDLARPFSPVCPKCGEAKMAMEGEGTEKLEEVLQNAFPDARVARLDRDVASGKGVSRILEKMRNREIDILVGTQMVTKGHDLPEVTLVGVINADAALSIPDFRSAERAFHLLVQVAGRAGRGDKPGRVIVQTFNPKHSTIQRSVTHDVLGFIEDELAARRELLYPPFSRLVLVRIDDPSEDVARSVAEKIATHVRANSSDVTILGPAPAPIARIRNRYRFRILLRAKERTPLFHAAEGVEALRKDLPRSCRIVIDVDPVQTL